MIVTESMAQKDLKYSGQRFIDNVAAQLISVSSVLSLHGHTVASPVNEHFLSHLPACLSECCYCQPCFYCQVLGDPQNDSHSHKKSSKKTLKSNLAPKETHVAFFSWTDGKNPGSQDTCVYYVQQLL